VYGRLARLSTDKPLRLRFSDEAQELFYIWWPELEGKVRGGDLHPALAAHLSKYRSLMPSLALLFELADNENLDAATEVSLAHASQAAAWCAYLEAHARRIYGCIVSPELHAARELAEKIRQGRLPPEFSTRDVYLKGWSGLGTPDEARAALRILEDFGWVRPATGGDSQGRPSERWLINPGASEVKA
jgi:putative DNA primase/helicase